MPRAARNDPKLGAAVALVTAAIIVGVIVSPKVFAPETFVLEFSVPLAEGAAGISPGATVTLGGIVIGVVDRTEINADGDGPDYINIAMRIPRGTVIPNGSTAHLAADALGGAGRIEIVPPERPMRSPEAAPGQEGAGTPKIAYAKPKTTLEAAFGRHTMQRFNAAIDDLKQADFGALRDDFAARTESLQADFRELSAEVDASLATWQPQGSALADTFRDCVARAESIEALFSAGGTLDAQKLEAQVKSITADWQAIRADMAALETTWTEEVVPPASDMLSRLERAWQTLRSDADRMLTLVTEMRETSGTVSADMQLAGGQLSRAETEILFTPWNLLGGIFQGDRADETRDFSVRMVVQSATELRLASDATRQLLEADPRLLERYPDIAALLEEWLRAANARAEAVDAGVFRKMMDEPPAPALPEAPPVAP
jgi:ABC-type transporter Mla subunit MlaD